MIIYGDLVAILNFCVDFLLLLGAGWLTGVQVGLLRCTLAALFGAVYAFVCLLPHFSLLGSLPFRCGSLLAMAFVCFGPGRGSVKRALTFVLLSFALGGAAALMHDADFSAPIVGAAAVWGVCRVGLGGRIGGRRYTTLELENDGRRITLTALQDTGNALRDNLTGSSVIIVDGKTSEKLLGLKPEALRRPADTLLGCGIPKLRLLPYRTVGSPDGMLLAKKLRVRVGKHWEHRLVAFCPEKLGDDFQALTGGNEFG